MIRKWFIPKLIELGIKNRVWLQQDGAPAHFALPVRALLNAKFPDRWIGRGSNSFAWPPRSPDLTTPDNSLWVFIKVKFLVLDTKPLISLSMRLLQLLLAYQGILSKKWHKEHGGEWNCARTMRANILIP